MVVKGPEATSVGWSMVMKGSETLIVGWCMVVPKATRVHQFCQSGMKYGSEGT